MFVYIGSWGILLGGMIIAFRIIAIKNLSEQYRGKVFELILKIPKEKYFNEKGRCFSKIANIISMLLVVHLIMSAILILW